MGKYIVRNTKELFLPSFRELAVVRMPWQVLSRAAAMLRRETNARPLSGHVAKASFES